MQGASASWGCVRAPPTLRLRFSGLRLGSGGLACHECSYTQVRTARRFPPGRSGLTLKPVLALPALRPSGREPAPAALASPGPPGAVSVRRPPGSAGGPGEDSASRPRAPDVRRVEGAGPSRLGADGAAPAVSRGRGVGECAHPPSSAGLLLPSTGLGSGARAGAVTTPFWLVISSPRRARRGRTAHLSPGARPSGLPFRGRPARAGGLTPGRRLALRISFPGGRTTCFSHLVLPRELVLP